MSFTVYTVFKDSDYKLGSFKTYQAARKIIETARKIAEGMPFTEHQGFKIVERTSTYKKIFDSREDL